MAERCQIVVKSKEATFFDAMLTERAEFYPIKKSENRSPANHVPRKDIANIANSYNRLSQNTTHKCISLELIELIPL